MENICGAFFSPLFFTTCISQNCGTRDFGYDTRLQIISTLTTFSKESLRQLIFEASPIEDGHFGKLLTGVGVTGLVRT